MKVSGPAMPSALRLFLVCQSLSAFSIFGPNSPSASMPSLACSRRTGSPDSPFFRIAMSPSALVRFGVYGAPTKPPSLAALLLPKRAEHKPEDGHARKCRHGLLLERLLDKGLY